MLFLFCYFLFSFYQAWFQAMKLNFIEHFFKTDLTQKRLKMHLFCSLNWIAHKILKSFFLFSFKFSILIKKSLGKKSIFQKWEFSLMFENSQNKGKWSQIIQENWNISVNIEFYNIKKAFKASTHSWDIFFVKSQ